MKKKEWVRNTVSGFSIKQAHPNWEHQRGFYRDTLLNIRAPIWNPSCRNIKGEENQELRKEKNLEAENLKQNPKIPKSITWIGRPASSRLSPPPWHFVRTSPFSFILFICLLMEISWELRESDSLSLRAWEDSVRSRWEKRFREGDEKLKTKG